MTDYEHLPTKDLSEEEIRNVAAKVLKATAPLPGPDHPDWSSDIKKAVETVLGPVHVGQLAPDKMIFVRVEPDTDGLHGKVELTITF